MVMKKLCRCVLYFQEWMYIEKILMKLNICLFWWQITNCYENIIEFGIKSAILLKKGFDSQPVYNKKYLKTKIKSYEEKINTNLHNGKMPNEDFHHNFLSVILIDFIFNIGKHYYPQVFLEEYKYTDQEKKVTGHITKDLDIFSGEESSHGESYSKE